jgi:hypothetical protein
LRPLRGSHLVFARETVPLRSGLAWLHPRDRRPVFAHVWEGAVLVGTTDIDHPVAEVPATISPAEAEYLVEALRLPFPQLRLDAAQALSAFAGLRAIVVPPGEAHLPPSSMGRDSALWTRPGLVGITGGKLTTHRATAAEVLREVERQGVRMAPEPVPSLVQVATRLQGRLGIAGAAWVAARPVEEQAPLAGTPYSLAELRWSMRKEQVRRLDDLLLRRTRLGLVAARGGESLLPLLEDRAARISAGRGLAGQTKRRAIVRNGLHGTRRPHTAFRHDERPAARHRRRHAERARPRLRPRRQDARPRASAVRAAVRLAAAGLGGEGGGVVLAGPGRGLSRPVAAGRRRARADRRPGPHHPARHRRLRARRRHGRFGRRSSGPTSASAARHRRSDRSGPRCSAWPAPAS